MKTKVLLITILSFAVFFNCEEKKKTEPLKEVSQNVEKPFVWEGANIYFLLTDRFNNGDASNDINFDRNLETGVLRGF